MIGENLLHYRILSKIGQGGMGEVYLALDTKLQRQVALKLLPPEIADQSRRWERFVRETRAVAALNHPNIVTIYAVEEADGKHFFTMELVSGETLDRLIPPRGLAMGRFFELAVPLAGALASAHACGITHRDLKPENVMVTREGRVKVLDFGMAKRSDVAGEGESTGTLTEEGTVVGTARYMSPEQASGQPLDHRSDIFSLGIVLFEMATGSYPFRGRNSIQVLSSILRDTPPRPTELRQGLPSRVGALIERCLEKEPEDRPQSAEELRAQLEELRSEPEAPGELSPDVIHTWAEPIVRPKSLSPTYSSGRSTSVPGAMPALAVLPLTDLSGQPDYFVEGLTEELITSVAKIRSLRVISRQSAMRYRGSTKLLSDIARELGVDHVLEGTVMRAGNRVRISLQLLRAEPEQHLWAERYDRDLGDVLALQSEVALAVAGEIEVKLSAQEERLLGAARTVAPEVLESYLEGRHHWSKRSADSLERALSCFQRAIAADPTYAPSHAGLADSLALLGQQKSIAGVGMRAKAAARQALELDPGLGEAHASLGFVSYFYEWDWETAERELRRALELTPNLVNGHHWLWSLLTALRRFDEARRSIRRARELDPLAPIIVNNLGVHHFITGDSARAAAEMRRAIELEPGFLAAHLGLWQVYQSMEDLPAAARELASGLRVLGLQEPAAALERRAGDLGYGAAMEALADELQRVTGPTLPLEAVAWMYLANDNRIKALGLLQKALERRSPAVVWLGVAPGWAPLRSERRYWEVLEQLRLPAPPA